MRMPSFGGVLPMINFFFGMFDVVWQRVKYGMEGFGVKMDLVDGTLQRSIRETTKD